MKAYKLVDKLTDMGSNAALYRKKYGTQLLLNTIKGNELEPYFPQYIKGAVIKKVPYSPGIMAFENLQSLKEFQEYNNLEETTKVVEVEGKPCKKQGKPIYAGMGYYPEQFTACQRRTLMDAPKGTVFFDFITVGGEYNESI